MACACYSRVGPCFLLAIFVMAPPGLAGASTEGEAARRPGEGGQGNDRHFIVIHRHDLLVDDHFVDEVGVKDLIEPDALPVRTPEVKPSPEAAHPIGHIEADLLIRAARASRRSDVLPAERRSVWPARPLRRHDGEHLTYVSGYERGETGFEPVIDTVQLGGVFEVDAGLSDDATHVDLRFRVDFTTRTGVHEQAPHPEADEVGLSG